jgi:hypothetical protein
MKRRMLCLSSGRTPQYRLDVLRLLALPRGTEIQFRYDADIVESSLHDELEANSMQNTPVLLAHVDCNDDSKPVDQRCPVTPCRHGKLIDSKKLGNFFILRFTLLEFAPCAEWNVLSTKISDRSPHWTEGRTDPVGLWCFSSDLVNDCPGADGPGAWQEVVKRLWRTKDFNEEEFFFSLTGIYSRNNKKSIAPHNGEFELNAGKEYEFKIFHFHPKSDGYKMPSNVAMLRLETGPDYLTPVTTPVLPIDSPYDLKSFHVRTGSPATSQYTSAVLRFVKQSDATAILSKPELFIPIKVKPSQAKLLISTLLIAMLLFLQQVITAIASGSISNTICLVQAGLAVLTALFVVYNLKKPLD